MMGALLLARAAQAFYLPGVAPTNFIEGQRVELKVRVWVWMCAIDLDVSIELI